MCMCVYKGVAFDQACIQDSLSVYLHLYMYM